VAVSDTYPNLIRSFQALGIKTVSVDPNYQMDQPIQSHADMQCHHLGGKEVIVAFGRNSLRANLESYGFHVRVSVNTIKSPYPNDVALNAARINHILIANLKTLDQSILDYCKLNQLRLIPVKQGYAKCSTAVVDKNSIITSDRQIAKAAITAGIDVLMIQPGSIELKGYDYGFIGGACCLLGKNQIAFVGNPKSHPDYPSIQDFLDRRKINIISLMDGPLRDVGGIIPLMEKVEMSET
jgi:hypothetical protein